VLPAKPSTSQDVSVCGALLARNIPHQARGSRLYPTETFGARAPCLHPSQDVLAQAEINRWLRGEMSANELRPAPEARFRERRVSTRLNKSGVGDDDPTVIEPQELELDARRCRAQFEQLPATSIALVASVPRSTFGAKRNA
jgi:hypothetical protein